MGSMDPLNIISRLGDDVPNPPTDAELNSAESDLKDALDAATTADTPDLELAKDLRAALDTVRSAKTKRAEELENQREEARKLREGIFDEESNDPDDEDSDDDDSDEESTDQTDTASAEEDKQVEEPVQQPVAAASVIERLRNYAAAKAPAPVEPRVRQGATLKAIGPASGFDIERGDFSELGAMFSTHAKSVMSDGKSAPLARLSKEYPEGRRLGNNVELNNKRITDVYGFGARSRPVTAAGGLCGPGEVDHSHPICSDSGRPIRDGMAGFNASRGQVTFSPAMSLGDMSPNVSIWTSENDANPTDPVTKPCPPLECPEELTCAVDAIVRCVQIGNFQAQFSPEFWAASLEVLLAAFDRAAEQKIIQEIDAGSTDLGVLSDGNVLASFLMAINSIVASDRSAHRNMTGSYTLIADAFLRDALRNQVIANLGVANNVDAIQIADSQIAGWLSDVNVTPIWTYDGTWDGTDHRILTPGAMATDTSFYLYPDDAWMFLDGGTLDLGTSITDSTLNSTNDRQAFAESFEKACFRGCSSYKGTIALDTACGCTPAGS